MYKKLGSDPFSEKTQHHDKYLNGLFHLPNLEDSQEKEVEVKPEVIIDIKQNVFEFIIKEQSVSSENISREFNITPEKVMTILKTLESEDKISLG